MPRSQSAEYGQFWQDLGDDLAVIIDFAMILSVTSNDCYFFLENLVTVYAYSADWP